MISSPVFSIIIPTFCRPDVLGKTLSCLERQECSVPFELILVNDGPADALPELKFGSGKRSNWRLIQNPRNLGRAATRNRGIAAAKGEYVLMLDDDIWAVPGLVQAHYERQMEVNNGIIVGSIPIAHEVSHTIWNEYVRRRYARLNNELVEKAEQLPYYCLFTGNCSLLRSALVAIGGFNEHFRYYSFEDTELGLRLQKSGIKLFHAPHAVGYHYSSEDMKSLCRKSCEWGRSIFTFGILHPLEALERGYGSYCIKKWKGRDIINNAFKIALYNNVMKEMLKTIVLFFSFLNNARLCFYLMPWLELQNQALGFKQERKHKQHCDAI